MGIVKKIVIIIGLGGLGLFLVMWGFGMGQTSFARKHGYSVPRNIAPPLVQDPVLISDSKKLGIDYSSLNLSFKKNLVADDVRGNNSNTIGTFQAPNSITIKRGLSKQAELAALAYEYMHYSWLQLSSGQRKQLAKEYQHYYNINSNFRFLNKNYSGTQDILDDERNSVACTLVQPALLTDSFNNYCNQFIKNRYILFE